MFYALSKILWFFATPSNALLSLAILGALLALTRFVRLGRSLAALGLAGLLACGLGPIGNDLIIPLETRFSVPAATPAPYGIVVLGGGVEDRVSWLRGTGRMELNEAGDRITALVELARLYPEAKLVFSGGSGDFIGASQVPEADVVRDGIARLGIDPARITFENRSRNTDENARFTADLVGAEKGRDWWLVTSAFHMPRAIGCFRAAGFNVRAYPVDFRTGGGMDLVRFFATLGEGLRRTDLAAKEWMGLLAYRLTNKTSALFPAP